MHGRASYGAGLRRLALAGALAALAGAGCARLFASYDVAANGLQREDDRLRRLLVSGHADSALQRVVQAEHAAHDDELLRSLYTGVLAHYAGAYDTSNAALERAARLAEDRYTKSISRAALSLITSDRTLHYEPGWSERLLIHYFGALNRLRQGDEVGAAVEARRLGALLERETSRDPDPRSRPLLAFLRYFSGVVFEATGEYNDADVAYRNALRLSAGPDSLPPPPPLSGPLADTVGELVVVIEQAFVAHRVEQSIVVPLHPVEVGWLTGEEGDERAAAAARVAARVVAAALLADRPRDGYYRQPPTIRLDAPSDEDFADVCRPGHDKSESDSTAAAGDSNPCDSAPYILRIAWPTHRLDRKPTSAVEVVFDDSTAVAPRHLADVSEAVIRDFDDERTLLLARTIARGVSKLALTKGVEKSVGDGEEWVGTLLGVLTNVGTALLEQADTRSWQLLPGRLGLVRVRLAPGRHRVAVRIGEEGTASARLADLGSFEVEPGGVTVVSARLWR